jgi:hypothetical protein
MASSNLMLHRGGKLVTREELEQFKAPPPEGRWYPVVHARVRDRVRETLDAAGYQIVKEQLAVARDGQQFFGVMDLATPVSSDKVCLSIGVRNSVNKTFPLGFCAGSRVVVCDNLSFHSELMVRRKHTRFGEQRFNQAIAEAVSKLASFRDEEAKRVEVLQSTELSDVLAESLILRAWERGVILTHQLPRVVEEWRKPSHEEFAGRTAWSLFNAITAALKERSVTQPRSFVAATMQLHHLLEFQRGETDAPQLQTAI